MEQLTTVKPLPEYALTMLRLSVAYECLNAMSQITPGADHTKLKRTTAQLAEKFIKDIRPRLVGIRPRDMRLFKEYAASSTAVIEDITKNGATRVHVLLNLVSYCMEKIPTRAGHWTKLEELFKMSSGTGAWHVKEDKKLLSGDSIFARIERELKIPLA